LGVAKLAGVERQKPGAAVAAEPPGGVSAGADRALKLPSGVKVAPYEGVGSVRGAGVGDREVQHPGDHARAAEGLHAAAGRWAWQADRPIGEDAVEVFADPLAGDRSTDEQAVVGLVGAGVIATEA